MDGGTCGAGGVSGRQMGRPNSSDANQPTLQGGVALASGDGVTDGVGVGVLAGSS